MNRESQTREQDNKRAVHDRNHSSAAVPGKDACAANQAKKQGQENGKRHLSARQVLACIFLPPSFCLFEKLHFLVPIFFSFCYSDTL